MSFLQVFETAVFLSLLIFLHELGHFLAAKLSKMGVEEFGLGYPPRLWGKKVGDTLYSLNVIPFGGFCKFSRKEFGFASCLRRAVVVSAGVLANFFWGWFLFSALFAIGRPSYKGEVRVVEVVASSPAGLAGIVEGDTILSVAGVAVDTTDQLISEVQKHFGQDVYLEVRSDGGGDVRTVQLIPREDPPEGEGALGVTVEFLGQEVMEKTSVWMAPVRGFQESFNVLREMVIGLGKITPRDMAGPVGVYQMAATVSKQGLRYLMQFGAFLSFNLFLLNLLPIPALDGGQLVFIAIEAVRRKKVRPEIEQWVNGIGMAFLAILAIFLTIQDVKRLF